DAVPGARDHADPVRGEKQPRACGGVKRIAADLPGPDAGLRRHHVLARDLPKDEEMPLRAHDRSRRRPLAPRHLWSSAIGTAHGDLMATQEQPDYAHATRIAIDDCLKLERLKPAVDQAIAAILSDPKTDIDQPIVLSGSGDSLSAALSAAPAMR